MRQVAAVMPFSRGAGFLRFADGDVGGPKRVGFRNVGGPERVGFGDVGGPERVGFRDVGGPEGVGFRDVGGPEGDRLGNTGFRNADVLVGCWNERFLCGVFRGGRVMGELLIFGPHGRALLVWIAFGDNSLLTPSSILNTMIIADGDVGGPGGCYLAALATRCASKPEEKKPTSGRNDSARHCSGTKGLSLSFS
jgi:hypothetical protein